MVFVSLKEPAHIQDNVSMSDMKHEQLKGCFVLIRQHFSRLQMQKKRDKEGSVDVVVNAGMKHILFLSDKEGAGASRRGRSNDFSSESRSNIGFHRSCLQGRKK